MSKIFQIYKRDSGDSFFLAVTTIFILFVILIFIFANVYWQKYDKYSFDGLKKEHHTYYEVQPVKLQTTIKEKKLPKQDYFFTTSDNIKAENPDKQEINYESPEGLSDIKDTKSQELFAQAVALRNNGEVADALLKFRELSNYYPNHPRILYEISVTYEIIGNVEKAKLYWRRIYKMGDKAGSIYQTIVSKLGKSYEQSTIKTLDGNFGTSRLLTFNNVKVRVENAKRDDEKAHISFHIRAEPGAVIDYTKFKPILIAVDKLSSGSLELTNMQSSEKLLTPPLDWNNAPEEIFNFVFTRPQLTKQEKIDLGGRHFYGFKAWIEYDGKIIDMVAVPSELKEMDFHSLDIDNINGGKSSNDESQHLLFYKEGN